MKKLSEVKVNAIVVGVLMCLCGTLLILRPEKSVNIASTLLALGLGVMAVVHLFRFLFKVSNPNVIENNLGIGISFAVVACFVGLKPEMVREIIPVALSILLVCDGAGKVQNSYFLMRQACKNWWVIGLVALVNVVIGIVMLWNPFFDNSKDLIIAIGICLIYSGVTDLVALIFLARVLKSENEKNEIVPKENEE